MPRTDPSSNNPSQRQSLCSARTLFWHKSIGLWNELWNLEIGARHERTSEDHLIWKKHHEELGFVLNFHSIFRSSSSSSWCCPFRLRLFRWYLFLPFGSPRWLRGGSCRRLWGFNWLLITWTWIPPEPPSLESELPTSSMCSSTKGLLPRLAMVHTGSLRRNWKGKTGRVKRSCQSLVQGSSQNGLVTTDSNQTYIFATTSETEDMMWNASWNCWTVHSHDLEIWSDITASLCSQKNSL